MKQNPNGDVLWVTQFDGTDITGVKSIVVDSQNNVYTTGYFRGNSITIGNSILTSSEQEIENAFVTKQDTSGNVLWAEKIGQTDYVSVEKITIDTSDNICIVGNFEGTIDFGGITLIKSK